MKFEDLKLPAILKEHEFNLARSIYNQMHAHYEAKLAEAKPEPEELFEHHDMPGKRFRRLKVGEVIQHGDWTATKGNPPGEGFLKTVCAGLFVESGDANYFYREVPQPAPEWRLPDPPPGQQWHRDDWTQDMLPEGYRPLLLGEDMQIGDERYFNGKWETKTTNCGWVFENADEYHVPGRTSRPML